jgi:hypothetical protein
VDPGVSLVAQDKVEAAEGVGKALEQSAHR